MDCLWRLKSGWSWASKARAKKSSRWHSSNSDIVRSDDFLGDFLVMTLQKTARIRKDDKELESWSQELKRRLEDYENEPRLLIKLANTGRIIRILESAIETSVDLLQIRGTADANLLRKAFTKEREERVSMFKFALDHDNLSDLAGDHKEQLEVLALLKHDFEKNGDVLTPNELDVFSAVFDWIVRRIDIVASAIPDWFATTLDEWFDATKTAFKENGEEECLRQVSLWSKLQHPRVRILFGACHVGEPFVIHEGAQRIYIRSNIGLWNWVHRLASGLQYVHELDSCLSTNNIRSMLQHWDEEGIKHRGLGLPLQPSCLEDSHSTCKHNDILAFGLAVFGIICDERAGNKTKWSFLGQKLPTDKPAFIRDDEWGLLCGMCATEPAARMTIRDVVHTIEDVANSHIVLPDNGVIEDIAAYIFPLAGQTIEDLLQEAHDLCNDESGINAMNRSVYDRLKDVYKQLVGNTAPLAKILIEDYCSILDHLLDRLRHQAGEGFSLTATICASQTLSNHNYSLHHAVDGLLLKHPEVNRVVPVHDWKKNWKRINELQRKKLETCMENPSKFLAGLPSEQERSEAAALLEYEVGQPLINGVGILPRWFIPPYQVQLGRHIADGSFGSVYFGGWLGAVVVVKQVLTNQEDPASREQYRREVELWFSLNSEKVIKLYGACHVGRLFFVCEHANQGTLVSYLKGKNVGTVLRCLSEAASGLEYLHDNGIIHGDLKGNNILVTDGAIKLADFGLSFLSSEVSDDQQFGSGAVRWKAPECLLGSRPSFASDIYSLGMCFIEAVTGEYPWGPTIPDEAVKVNVTVEKKIPSRPAMFTDRDWDLVKRMCCFDPDERINAAAVVQILNPRF